MNRRSTTRLVGLTAAASLAVAALAGCSTGGGDEGDGDGDVTITWWHNATSDPLPGRVGRGRRRVRGRPPRRHRRGHRLPERGPPAHADPERPRVGRRRPTCSRSGRAASFATRSEAELPHGPHDVIRRHHRRASARTVNPWQVDGKHLRHPVHLRHRGLLVQQGPVRAGRHRRHAPNPRRARRRRDKLREASASAPIAVGAGDKWPAAHWWYQFALARVLDRDAADGDPRARLQRRLLGRGRRAARRSSSATEPVPGGLPRARPASRAPTAPQVSSPTARLRMELMGHWNSGVIGSLTPDDRRFPSSSAGSRSPASPAPPATRRSRWAAATASAARRTLRRSASSCSSTSSSEDVQKRFAGQRLGHPDRPGCATASIDDPNLQGVAEGLADVRRTSSSGSTPTFGPTVGNALNEAIVNLFGGARHARGHRQGASKTRRRRSNHD